MKIMKNSLIISLFLFFAASGFGQEAEKPKGFTSQVAPELFHYHYRETNHGEFFMENKGTLAGIRGEARYHFAPNYIGLSTHFAFGKTDYHSNGAGTLDNDPYHYVDTRLTHGYRFQMTPCFEIAPYWGVGYRYLENDTSGRFTSTGYHYGYFRSTKYLYFPVGTELVYLLNCQSRAKLDIEFDLLLVGFQRSELRSATITNRQNTGYGFRLSCSYEYDLECLTLGIKPFMRYWLIDDSDYVYNPLNGKYYLEPHNATKEIGVGVTFSF